MSTLRLALAPSPALLGLRDRLLISQDGLSPLVARGSALCSRSPPHPKIYSSHQILTAAAPPTASQQPTPSPWTLGRLPMEQRSGGGACQKPHPLGLLLRPSWAGPQTFAFGAGGETTERLFWSLTVHHGTCSPLVSIAIGTSATPTIPGTPRPSPEFGQLYSGETSACLSSIFKKK